MRAFMFLAAVSMAAAAHVQQPAPAAPQADDPVKTLVARLDLEQYKATLKGLTQFGDRRQGTARNRAAVDWIEAQLKSYGCTNTERVTYQYAAAAGGNRGGGGQRAGGGGAGAAGAAAGGDAQAGAAGGGQRGGGGGGRGGNQGVGRPTPTGGEVGRGATTASSGATIFGWSTSYGVNRDLMRQPDERIRALNVEEPVDGERQLVFCTKIGTTRPDEMYILGAHMDGHGVNEAVNDDGSGTALVMELARVFHSPDVQTERSIRFALWNNEETGLNGARAYVAQRKDLQGIENPKGSGKYPEPKWLGMIQHDMMMWDHGMPQPVRGPDGKPQVDAQGRPVLQVSKEQRPEADVNIEFQSQAVKADEAMKLAFFLKAANEKYATDYPAAVGPHMTNTDSDPFKDLIPAISLRENERGAQTGAGWNPTWHTPLDVWTTFSDKDFRLGLNAAQTTLGGVAQLAGATIKK